jgi:chorismate mutase
MDLQEIREHLDRIDKTIVFMLAERMSLIPKVAEYKKENHVERYQPEREKEIMQVKRALAEELKLNPDLVEDLFKRIIQDAHRIEKDILGEADETVEVKEETEGEN